MNAGRDCKREEEIMLCALSPSPASRRPFLVNPQKEMKREWRSLSQFAEYDVERERERDGTSMDVMMLCRAEEKENDNVSSQKYSHAKC